MRLNFSRKAYNKILDVLTGDLSFLETLHPRSQSKHLSHARSVALSTKGTAALLVEMAGPRMGKHNEATQTNQTASITRKDRARKTLLASRHVLTSLFSLCYSPQTSRTKCRRFAKAALALLPCTQNFPTQTRGNACQRCVQDTAPLRT